MFQMSINVTFRNTTISSPASTLAQAGVTVVDMQVAGRWKSSQMPAHYAKAELAERGRLRGLRMGRRDNQLYCADDSHQTTRTNVVIGRYSMKADENRNSETGYSGTCSVRDRIRTT